VQHKIAYVVPTKDRPDDLRKMLASVAAQSRLPDQVVVVDGSSPTIEGVLKDFPGLSLTYVRVFPPGLAKQRNAGMAQVRSEITIAGYLDDDLVLEPDATEKMLAFWEKAGPDVGGAAFCTANQPSASSGLSVGIGALFKIADRKPGILLSSGFQSQIPAIDETIETDWLYGGATIWRCEVVAEFSYDEWYVGTGYLEDVDYSYRVHQKYRLFVIGEARVNHYSRPVPLERNFLLGRHQVINRTYFVKKMKKFSQLPFAWGIVGQVVHNVASSVARRDTAGIRRAGGNLLGIYDVLTGHLKQIEGHYK
jgi:GT2 family glycosyltransferase